MLLRSLFSGVSGLRNHQTYLDVVGNNIANVNTTGFRASRVTFQSLMSQTLRPAAAPTANLGGINPVQVGLGAILGGIDTIQTQGSLQTTGKLTDLALEGDGFFIMADGPRQYYSRDGAFDLASDGTLINPTSGLRVMGWMAQNGQIDTAQAVGPLTIPIGQSMRASASTSIKLAGNVSLSTATGSTVDAQCTVRDSLGASHTLDITFTRTGAGAWTWQAASAEGLTVTPSTPTALTFDANGQPILGTPGPTLSFTPANGASPVTLALDLSGLTQLDGESALTPTADGAEAGSLTTFSIDQSGIVSGVYSNGVQVVVGQIGLARFPNPGGLLSAGANLLDVSANSGQMQLISAGGDSGASIMAGALESSNVDLAQELTNMMVAERGFQANSRVITVADQLLENLVNLGR
jgi:flagellar hook protein FlgE